MTQDQSPIIVWIRRDLRLHDHGPLRKAAQTGRPVIPVFICDPNLDAIGATPKWRFGLGIAHFAGVLEQIGSRLILRRGAALACLRDLIAETGTGAVYWQRAYDPVSKARDTAVKAALKEDGIVAESFTGQLLFEPWTVETKTGGFYKVYSPFWRAVKDRGIAAALDPVKELRTPRLSEPLTYGEISPRVIWHAGMRAMSEGKKGTEHFLKELVWREFAYHLLHHTPDIDSGNWRPEWDAFP